MGNLSDRLPMRTVLEIRHLGRFEDPPNRFLPSQSAEDSRRPFPTGRRILNSRVAVARERQRDGSGEIGEPRRRRSTSVENPTGHHPESRANGSADRGATTDATAA